MEYWIDGYNLILRRGEPLTLQAAREKLLRDLVPLGASVHVFFDARLPGAGGPGMVAPSSKIRVTFSAAMSADDLILSELTRCDANSVTLVTDDRELRGSAKQRGANTLGVAKFLEQIRVAMAPKVQRKSGSGSSPDDPRPSRRLKAGEVQEWLDLFGFDDPELGDPDLTRPPR